MPTIGPFPFDGNEVPFPVFRLDGTHQSVAYTGTAGTISNAVGADTSVVRVVATSACYIAIGETPTATSSGVYLPAGVPEYVRVVGGTDKISAIQVSSGGTLHVTEVT